jgi:uncharacterized protein involved in outer membrane biogenesis
VSTATLSTPPSIKKIFLWIAGTIIFIILALAATIFFLPTHLLQHVAGEKGSSQLGRDFSIDGPISITWDWATPEVHLSQIHLANAAGSADPNMVAIDRVDFHIKIWKLLEGQLNFPDITITKPVIILEKYDEKNKNWDFPVTSKANAASHAVMPSRRGNFPVLGQLTINDGKMVYRDKTKNLDVTLGINTVSGGGGEQGEFKLSGQGALQDKPFSLDAQGGSLDMLRNSGEKYPLHVHIKMGDTVVDVNGTFLDPIKMEGVDTTLDLHGDSLADLFYLTMLPLPPTPTYQLSGHLVKQGGTWTFENFAGKVGNSDLEGNLSYDTSQDRGSMKAGLTSKLLDMKDLAGFLGATPAPRKGENASPEQIKKANEEKANAKLIPDVKLDLTRLRATDMDVTLKATRILAPGLPMDNMDVRFNLKSGVLRVDPLDFGMASGQVAGWLVLDGSKDIPHVETDISLTRLSLKQFFAHTQFEALSNGSLGGRFKIAGDGKSLAEVLGAGNGEVTFVMSGGTVSQLLVDAAGLDVGQAAPLLIGKDKAANIRCAVGDFGVSNGILDSKAFVFDTSVSNIAGNAHVSLKDETIDAKIEAEPKSVTVTAHMPIIITGALKHPTIMLDAKEASGRAAGAAVLSVFLTPLAAIIPFIETGVGKDSDCNGLIEQARIHAGGKN